MRKRCCYFICFIGKSLIIRGNETETAVLCSNSKTYSFKVAEVSNPMLLSSNVTYPEEIDSSKERSLKKTEVTSITFRNENDSF